MINTKTKFYGQQENEKILYTVKSHGLALFIRLLKIYTVSFATVMVTLIFATFDTSLPSGLVIIVILLSILFAVLGTRISQSFNSRTVSYITDRRLVRFEPTTFFATNIRTLSWDEAVKVKTYSPNLLWKQMMVGTVVVHARTTVKTSDESQSHTAADDIEINDVYLYRDLGNYIDKILFTYKQLPREVSQIHPFVPKPKGQRY